MRRERLGRGVQDHQHIEGRAGEAETPEATVPLAGHQALGADQVHHALGRQLVGARVAPGVIGLHPDRRVLDHLATPLNLGAKLPRAKLSA
jgi:hypothetical protein